MPSSFTPPPNEHQELENICKEIEHTPINIRKSKDNLMNLRKVLELLLEKINANKIIIKPAHNGSITVVMTPKDYWNMCYRHFSDTKFYNNRGNNDPSTIVQDRVNKFAEKYKSILTNNEYDFQTIEHLQNDLPLLQRFTKQFVLEGLSIVLKFNYFYNNKSFFHQIKGTVTGTKFAVVGSNLVVAFKEIKLFALLPQIYSQDFVDFILRNYFRFLDDIFHKWLENFDIKQFYDLINSLDEDLKFIFENPSSSIKWGHLGHFDLETNSLTNLIGSSGPLWARLYNNNYKNQNKN